MIIDMTRYIEPSHTLPPGGYIAEITAVQNNADKEYLKLTFDIAEGRFKGFYGEDKGKDYTHCIYKSYREEKFQDFAGFLDILEQSNPGNDLKGAAADGFNIERLIGKRIGLVLAREQYTDHEGIEKMRLFVASVETPETITNQLYFEPNKKRFLN